jgi:hypothetical protein
MTPRFSIAPFLLAPLVALGCNETHGAPAPTNPTAPSASAPHFERSAPAGSAAEEEPALAGTQPAGEGAPEGEPGDEGAPAPEASASAAPPAADVEITNHGMHIGGSKNTEAEKQPIREAVRAHYDAMRACYAKHPDPPKESTYGVDMRIDREGGRAKISNPRNGFNKEVGACLLAAFEAVEFPKPPQGAQMVSFSLKFKRK